MLSFRPVLRPRPRHPEMTFRLFSVYATWALIPVQCPIFPRSRWTNYDGAVHWCGLLSGCHGILNKIFVEIAGKPTRDVEPAGSVGQLALAAEPATGTEDDWNALYQQDSVATGRGNTLPEDVQGSGTGNDGNNGDDNEPGDEKTDWVKQKRQNKQKARAWAFSRPLERLAIIAEVIQILLSCMYDFIFLSGQAFEKKQQVLASKKGKRTYPVLVAAENNKVESSVQALLGLLWKLPQAVALSNLNASLRAKRFQTVSSAVCSLHLLLRIPRRGCPFQVFSILTEGAEKLLQVPKCMQDPLANMILEHYAPWCNTNVF